MPNDSLWVIERSRQHAGRSLRCPCVWWDGGGCASTVTTRTFGQYMPDKDNFGAVIQNVRNDLLRGEHAKFSADFEDLERRPREQSDRHGGGCWS